ncbi:MAG: aryl-sulfate sulfotransferase [Prolixibacteraceae bacterium]|jgi:hypothetical protein
MRKLDLALILLSFLIAFASCTKENLVQISDVLKEVRVTDDNNKLRNTVEIQMKEPASVQVRYWKSGNEEAALTTPFTEETLNQSVKLILLEPDTLYNFRVTTKNSSGIFQSDVFSFNTRSLPEGLSPFENKLPDSKFRFKGYINIATKPENSYLYLINDKGKIVWYQSAENKTIVNSTFDPLHNTFQCILGQNPNEQFGGDEILVLDLYGNTIFKRNYDKLKNPDVHHDFKRLPNGDLITINRYKKEFDLSSKGGGTNDVVNGDGLTVMDLDGNVKWEWNCFSAINPLDYSFIMDAPSGMELSPRDDLMHANSVTLDTDGNYLMTFNRINQLWKIDSNTGHVYYKLGLNGDINMSEDGYTSGIHSAHINPDGEIMVVDNGKINKQTRAVSYMVDETSKTAVVKKNIKFPKDLFTMNQGSGYMIDSQHVLFGSTMSETMAITDLSGIPAWQYQTDKKFYRAYYINEIDLTKSPN